jgi:Thiolase, C-terminal domain
VLLMTRREALRRGLPVLGIFRSFAAVGVDPAIMGIGPAVAIPAALAKVRAPATQLVLFGLQDRTFGPCLAAVPATLAKVRAALRSSDRAGSGGWPEFARQAAATGPIWHADQDLWSLFSSHA